MKLALVLSGGGAKGAFSLGVIKYLEEQNVCFDAYSGTSIGSIITCLHASGYKAEEIFGIFKSDEIKKLIKFNYFKKGLLKIDHKNEFVKNLMSVKKLEDLNKPVFINAYDLKQKQMHYFSKGNIIDLCLAASALIPIFKPIKYENMNLIDGGLIDNIPVKPFVNTDYKILSIDVMPRHKKTRKINLNPLKMIKKRIFKELHKNLTYSIAHSHYYISSLKLKNYRLLSFKDLDACYTLGYKEAKIQLKDFLKDYKA